MGQLDWVRRMGSRYGLGTALALLAVPSMRQLQEANDALEAEVAALREAQATLEQRVEERTAALAEAHAQAEAADRLKDELLATVSHQLRSPLNSIAGWLHILDKASAGLPETRQAIDKIRGNVDLQARLIGDLLDLSRIVTGKLRLEMRRVDPVALLEDTIASVRAAATAKRIDLTLTMHSRDVPVAGDRDRLGQAVSNLLSNALKFTPEGGRIEVSLQQTGTQLGIVVADNGEGIDPAFLPHVFERFRPGDAGNRRAQGLGVGLAVVRRIVEMHGGSVHAHSPGKGQGAVFTIRLPLLPADSVA